MSPERKRVIVSVVVGVAATAAVVLLIGKAAHYADLLTRLRDAQPGWLLLCAAGEALAYAGFIASYQAMAELDGGPKLSYSTVARIVGTFVRRVQRGDRDRRIVGRLLGAARGR